MKKIQPVDNSDLKHVELFFYLIPVIGFFPSLWTLYRHRGSQGRKVGADTQGSPARSREQLAVSRLSVTLALSWLLGYFLLGFGAETSEFLTVRFLILNSLLTSGYFAISIWLMVRISARKSARLPGFSRLATFWNKVDKKL